VSVFCYLDSVYFGSNQLLEKLFIALSAHCIGTFSGHLSRHEWLMIKPMVFIKNSELESIFFRFCVSAEIKTFIDIGSNQPKNGDRFLEGVKASNSTSEEHVYYAFEANPFCFSYYFEKRKSNFIYLNTAISDHNGFLEMYLPNVLNKNTRAGFFKIIDRTIFRNYHSNLERYELANNLGGSLDRHKNSSEKFIVQVLRLDTIMSSLKNKTVLWIDVEGSLHKVLDGCGELLGSENLVGLFVEAEEPIISDVDWLKLDSHKLLTRAGFKLHFYSDSYNGFYVKRGYEQSLSSIDVHHQDVPALSKRHTYLLRLKSLIFIGNDLMKKWQKN
jgi:FkbM family methyltransferase